MAESELIRPFIISWNLTYRCNLQCEHCYLDAGYKQEIFSENFSDRSELDTRGCYRVIDQIAKFAPESLVILTGGEPLLRKDILKIIAYGKSRDLWIVVGSNGVRITEKLAGILKKSGVRGMALSLDALDPATHDRFRKVKWAWQNTVNGAKILHRRGMPFIIQTTVGQHNATELSEIAAFAHETLGATVWNLYFLVPTGRGEFVSDISDTAYTRILSHLATIQKTYAGRMLVNAKCAPHFARTLFESDPNSPFLKSFTGGSGGCPAGAQYMGIRPNGDVTPCPYLPSFAGNLRRDSLQTIWQDSIPFTAIRHRDRLKGRCGICEFKTTCGGCRARAYGVSGSVMDEDPLCNYQPGKYDPQTITIGARLQYGAPPVTQIHWDDDAKTHIKRVPLFVRGMVIRAVEGYCKKNGIPSVSVPLLDEIREKMPTPKVFSR